MQKPQASAPVKMIERKVVDLNAVDSAALKRLIAEVRNESAPATGQSTAYNRTYHRHNR